MGRPSVIRSRINGGRISIGGQAVALVAGHMRLGVRAAVSAPGGMNKKEGSNAF